VTNLKRNIARMTGSTTLAIGALLAAPATAAPAVSAPGSCYVWDNEASIPGACVDQYTNFVQSGLNGHPT